MLKSTLISLVLCCLMFSAKGQTLPTADTWGLFNKAYSLNQAKEFEWDWEYEKAIWIYINLITLEDKKYIATRVKNLKAKVGDLETFINITFNIYIQLDPKSKNDPDMRATKRAWADELISLVK